MLKRFFAFLYCALSLSGTVKGMTGEELEQKADMAARSAYARLNKNWKYPENHTIHVSFTPSWEEKAVETTGGWVSMVSWNSEKQPHLPRALEEIFDAEALIMDCSNAARLVRLYMICQMLGEEKTLDLVSHIRAQYPDSPFNFMNALSWSFLEKVENVDGRGIYCFPFVNIEKYSYFKSGGNAINHNVVRLLDNTYLGFDPSFFCVPKNYGEVEQCLYKCFIKEDDVDLKKEEEHKKYSKILQSDLKIFVAQREKYQKKFGYYKFNMQKVHSFLTKGKIPN